MSCQFCFLSTQSLENEIADLKRENSRLANHVIAADKENTELKTEAKEMKEKAWKYDELCK